MNWARPTNRASQPPPAPPVDDTGDIYAGMPEPITVPAAVAALRRSTNTP
jgi:hypothetical protein